MTATTFTDAYGGTYTMPGPYSSMQAIQRQHERMGGYWFTPRTMMFFASRVQEGVYGGRMFITTERGPDGVRRASIRIADDEGHIATVGEFGAYNTIAQARREAIFLATGE